MKLCKTCNRNLPLDSFHKKKTGKQGRNSKCKECKSSYDHIRHERDSERLTKLALIRQKENPARTNAIQAKRRAKKMNNPIPDWWPPVDLMEIAAIYKKSTELGAWDHPVDHIVPLVIGGPHHQYNLRVVTRRENASKNNKLDDDDEKTGNIPYCFYREKPYTISITEPSYY